MLCVLTGQIFEQFQCVGGCRCVLMILEMSLSVSECVTERRKDGVNSDDDDDDDDDDD